MRSGEKQQGRKGMSESFEEFGLMEKRPGGIYPVRQVPMQAGGYPSPWLHTFQGQDLLFYLQGHWEIILEWDTFDALKDIS